MIGRDGMTGVSVVLGNGDRVPHEVYIQVAGRGVHLPADRVREAIAKSVTLHQVLLRYVHDFLTQTTQTAMANGRGKIEERLARWLLMAQDRVDGNELRLTHEFLAVMLGVPTLRHHYGAARAGAQGTDHAPAHGHQHYRPRRFGGEFQRCLPPTER